ncbi:MAG TPA: helix-turn-helix domain-containing protein [Balneolales bacterium]|nr:helix-turn-helix domain-containing protein [Balneolales bacterium]
MDSRRFNKLVEKVRWVRNHRILCDRKSYDDSKEVHLVSAVREKLSLTQERLAELMGVSVDDVSKWEMGFTDPKCSEKIVLWIADNYPEVFLEAAYNITQEK